MRDAIKTLVLTVILLCIFSVIFLFIINVEQGIELFTRTELPKHEPDVELLYKRIENNHHLRRASMNVNDLKNEELLQLVIDNLTKEDYTKKNIEPEKIVCQVTKNISFTTEDDKCNIRIINNDVFTNYIKKVFNIDKDIQFNSFDYHGYNCKNSGKKYYCMYTPTKDYVQGYSLFDSAYKTKNSIVISEYYVQVDLSDGVRCNVYFDEDYCADYKELDRQELDDKTIKEDGVLYEHVFALVDGKYYLQKSYVKIEG